MYYILASDSLIVVCKVEKLSLNVKGIKSIVLNHCFNLLQTTTSTSLRVENIFCYFMFKLTLTFTITHDIFILILIQFQKNKYNNNSKLMLVF